MEKKSMVYIQSGGPTPVINTSLYGAIKEARKHRDQIGAIYGSRYGIEGLINDNLIDINMESDKDIELLLQTPGAILGTSRFKLPTDFHDPIYLTILKTLEKHNVGYLFINGGNDSMDTCYKLSLLFKEKGVDIKVMGVPKTIDNDLACTDHSLGFPSAAKCVINVVQSIAIDAASYRKGKVFIIEIMGRNAGWLTATIDLLDEDMRPDLIYLPEQDFDLEDFLKKVKEIHERDGYCIVAISEGVHFERSSQSAFVDAFNHVQLGGLCNELCKIVESRLNIPTRPIELSLLQRANPLTISKIDQEEAMAIGALAVKSACQGITGQMVAIKRLSSSPYKTELVIEDLSGIANTERTLPLSMILNNKEMDVSYREYLKPLIVGEADLKWDNGILKYAKFKYVKVK